MPPIASKSKAVRDVLVALWPEPRDVERARDKGWYRVRPGTAVNRLGDLSRFRSLAFYQPDSFGTDGRRVRYRAPTLGYELLSRANCCRKSEITFVADCCTTCSALVL